MAQVLVEFLIIDVMPASFKNRIREHLTFQNKHSVDSAVSLRSQYHADRIRWPNKARYSQRRSVSELELASRAAPAPPRTNDLEYLDNPAENLEFAQRRLQHPPKAPRPRPEDDYYRHLTARVQDRWWHGSQGILQAPAALQVAHPLPGLRRSRSLAVIREESCAGPLIPRARLVDKPIYKDRFIRSKFQTKEEALERIYNKSTSSCYGDVSDNPNHASEDTILTSEGIYEEYKEENLDCGWVNSEGIVTNGYVPHTDEPHYSRNPSEIDSLDSNYLHKNYNFESHNPGIYKESSPDSTDRELGSETHASKGKLLFIRPNQTNTESSDCYVQDYSEGIKSDSDRSVNNVAKSPTNFHVLDQSNSEYNEHESDSSCERNGNKKEPNCQGGAKTSPESERGCDTSESESTKSIERVTTGPDKDNISVTSYVSVPNSTPETPPRRLENLAFSLAEKIDEYCDSKYSEAFVEIPLKLHSAGNSFNSKSYDDLNSIYTQVNKVKPNVVKAEAKVIYKDTLERHQKNYSPTENQLYNQYNEKFKPNQEDLKTRSLYRQGSSSKNITTEPFVTTLIENQYYSLPDINISKNLRRSEKIDKKLRESETPNLNDKDLNGSIESQTNLKDVSVVEVDGEEVFDDSLNVLVQRDRKVEEEELQIHKSNDHIPQPPLLPIEHIYEIAENKLKVLQEDCNRTVITVDGVIIEVEKKSDQETLLHKEEDKHIIIANESIKKTKDNIDESVFKSKVIKGLPTIPIKRDISKKEINSQHNGLNNTRSFTEKDLVVAKSQLNSTHKNRTSITKHYSLRQRDPKASNSPELPAPPNEEIELPKEVALSCSNNTRNQSRSSAIYEVVIRENRQVQRIHSFKSRENLNRGIKREENITILPLSGHQTIVVDPPITLNNVLQGGVKAPKENEHLAKISKSFDSEINTTYKNSSDELSDHCDENKTNTRDEHYHSEGEIGRAVTKQTGVPRVKKDRSFKIAAVQNKFEKPPPRLIIKDNKNNPRRFSMSRPQVLHVRDTRKHEKPKYNGVNSSSSESEVHENGMKNHAPKGHIYNVTEKVDKAVKTDLEYQEKLHSVKNYWSKLIDKSSDENENEMEESCEIVENMRECLPDEPENVNKVASVENIIKSIETVKIVDSIKKNSGETEIKDVWKKIDGSEKEKALSELETGTLNKKIVYDPKKMGDNEFNQYDYKPERVKILLSQEDEYKSFSPDIEIVELKNSNQTHHNDEVTHATLIKTKNYNKDNADFDHVRYKVVKPDLFRKTMMANYKKEAQFDGLLQYLQDFSFQELLVNNNIVIIEPVRTKVEANQTNALSKTANSCRITGATAKQNDVTKDDGGKQKLRKTKLSGIKRHFFYHPIRVNKEIIEEELPNPDTVKTVRNLFERTLTMRRPGESPEPSIEGDPVSSKRSSSHKNLTDDSKLDKHSVRKKVSRYLTIDTSYGHRKWDSASLSSGVSSGDLSSNNEHDYDTDALSPFQATKENNDNIYCSSSEEYLCESLNPSLCYESQYVSQDILEKIRECGTSITYYGGKVLDERSGPAVSPMTKQIMEEIRGLQRNCCRDCDSCQSKCTGDKCDCLYGTDTFSRSDTASAIDDDRISKCCACSEIMEKNDRHNPDGTLKKSSCDNYLGFKFKLVKSNSCSSRLELAGADDHTWKRKFQPKKIKDEEDPSMIYDSQNSVKTKICRIESYRRGAVPSPFTGANKCGDVTINNQVHNLDGEKPRNGAAQNGIDKLNAKNVTVNNHRTLASVKESNDKLKMVRSKGADLAYAVNAHVNIELNHNKLDKCEESANEQNKDVVREEQKTVAETIRCFNEPIAHEKKFYYVNDVNVINGDKKSGGKFGEMIFEEFQVLETSYDNTKNTDKK